MSTRSSKAVITACVLALGLTSLTPAGAGASVYSVTAPTGSKGGEKSTKAAAPEDVEGALEGGDLTTAREAARAAREKDPSAENWLREAQALERSGDLAGAVGAYQAHAAALPKDADAERADAEAKIAELKAQARGTVADEPESTHRDELDKARAKRMGETKPKKRGPKPAPPTKPKDEKIVRKWYFWVTLGAIVAAAGAITGIAIKAAMDDEPDSLDTASAPGPIGPTVIRF